MYPRRAPAKLIGGGAARENHETTTISPVQTCAFWGSPGGAHRFRSLLTCSDRDRITTV